MATRPGFLATSATTAAIAAVYLACAPRSPVAAQALPPVSVQTLPLGAQTPPLSADAPAGQPPARDRTEALAKRAGDRLRTLQQEADRLAGEERTLMGDLRKLEVDREIAAEQLRQIVEKGAAAERELAGVNDQVLRLEREDRDARPALSARLVELYKLGQGRYLRLLLSMSDVRRTAQASRMVAAVAKRDEDRVLAEQRRLAELQTSRRTIQERSRELAALRVDSERAQAAADRALTARNALIAGIDRQRDLNAQLQGELQAAQLKLQATLRGIVAGGGGAGGNAAEPSLPLRPFQGDLDWPVAALATGARAGGGAVVRPSSNGVEIAAVEGAPVQAIHEGTVAFADTFAGFGNLVIVEHGEHAAQTFSLYGNLLDMAVARGAHVERGQQVGTVGTALTAPAGTAGLYFELRVDGRPVDPLQWLKKR